MPLLRELILVGLSHRTAPVEVRERCAVAPAALGSRLAAIRALGGMDECLLLSTCNRTEAVVFADDAENGPAILRDAVFGTLDAAGQDAIYIHQGVETVFHVFRVASGLDSQVLGESQILAQIKDAAAAARTAGTLGPILGPLFEQALSLGKRVRTGTRVGEGTLSVARASVELARKVLGDLARTRALVVGAGETGLLVARHLADAGCKDLTFANRTRSRADDAAAAFNGKSIGLEGLAGILSDMNLTVVSVDAEEPVVGPDQLDPPRLRRHDRPPMLIDLSIPRGVDPALRGHRDLLVHDLDDLEAIVARHREERSAEVEAAGRMVIEETHKWFALRTYAAFKPAIARLGARFAEIREEVLAAAPARSAEIEAVADRLMRRLLDEALGGLKEGARHTVSEEQLGRRYRSYLEKK